MSAYPTLTNPLLTSSPPNNRRNGGAGTNSTMLKGLSSASFRNFFSRSFHQLSQAGSQIRLPATKRIGPSISFNEHHYKDHHIKKSSSNNQRSSSSTSSDPIIHYNGPCDTLDQLPDEKLEWIKHEPATAEALRHPLLDCPKSIVLRKPVTRSQTFPLVHEHVNIATPKATFYLRVIQFVHHNLTKPCNFRCSVQVGQSICTGQVTASEKCGKHNIQANVDETFLFDIDQPATAVLKVFTQPRTARIIRGFTRHQEETCIGKEEFVVPVQSCEKQLRRISLPGTPECQALVIYGTYVSSSAQVLLDNKCIYSGFITVYIRGQFTPKWERFWAALHGTALFLYDFEYRVNRPPLYTIPLYFFVQVLHPSMDDDERQVDVGPLGLALQFIERALSKRDLRRLEETPHFECRMYVLPDTMEESRDWEAAFAYVASLLDQYRNMDHDDDDDDYDNASTTYTGSLSLGETSSSYMTSYSQDIYEAYGHYDEDDYSDGTIEDEEDEDGNPIVVPSKFMW
ncbi:hypothetical protein O0I10_006513 [Lichtheimia ornata]|uniref:PH domain-containing protein n=1 Tax=Lichtheimia ornata TaxID=688661 RepID=A0AAD7XYJ6_9FUNG|nr:uncharacterized protein O0I10_006513 [Lichtheimia ornata]KAJ8657698.1 hypothetical protein O0I10_006513 [Lichtheimia ornata]